MLIERPYAKSFSKNDIRYVFELTDLSRSGLFLQVKIMYAAIGSTDFAELYTFDLKANSDGVVYFYIQGYLDSLLNYVLPIANTRTTDAEAQAKQFYIEHRELTDDDTNPDWNTDESDYKRIVFKGGIEKNKFDKNNVFVNYIEIFKPFLTWTPPSHFVFYDENVFLTFINTQISDALIKLVVVYTAADGTTDRQVITFTGDKLLYHINVCAASLNFTDAFTGKQNVSYSVAIMNSDESVYIVNPYLFFAEYRPLYKFYDLVYFNSLGGVDSVRVFGETDVNVTRDYDETEGGIKLDWNDVVNSYESAYTNIRLQRQYKGDIGYLRNRLKNEQEAFIDYLAAQKIYQLIDSRWIPIIGLQKSVDLGTNKDTRQSFPIEWSLSESNEVYTPDNKLFGAGVSTTVCHPVTVSGGLTAGTVGTPYSDSLDVTGGSLPIVSVTGDDLPDWLTVAYNADTNKIDFTGTPDAEFSGVLTLTITNCMATNIDVVLIIDPAETDEGTKFSSTTFVSGDDWDDNETIEIIGQADETVIVTVDNYVNGNGGTLTFNGVTVTAIGQTFTITLDGTGHSGTIHANITGNHAGPMPSAILGRFKITSATGGTIGTPDTYSISKVY